VKGADTVRRFTAKVRRKSHIDNIITEFHAADLIFHKSLGMSRN